MNSTIETVIIIAIVALAAAFVAFRIVNTLRSKRPACCEGKPGVPVKKAACPHCAVK
jgi:hypothetical protein